jgi:hypothetical protein
VDYYLDGYYLLLYILFLLMYLGTSLVYFPNSLSSSRQIPDLRDLASHSAYSAGP